MSELWMFSQDEYCRFKCSFAWTSFLSFLGPCQWLAIVLYLWKIMIFFFLDDDCIPDPPMLL